MIEKLEKNTKNDPSAESNGKLQNNKKNVRTKEKTSILPDKQFQARNSLLTDLFEINHIKTIYHIFIVIFTLLLFNVFVSDFVNSGKINFGLSTIIAGFHGFTNAFMIWISMQLTVFALYPVFGVWSKITRKFFSVKSSTTSLWHLTCVCIVVIYQCGFLIVFTKIITKCDLGKATSMAILLELVRFMMKSHAYIRSNVPRTLSSKQKIINDDDKSRRQILPTFGQYSYFIFAPTLIYRDNYPRISKINWDFVFKCFLEVLSVIFILSFIFERFMYPTYSRFGSKFYEIGVKELIISIFNSMLPGLFIFLCGFYCVI